VRYQQAAARAAADVRRAAAEANESEAAKRFVAIFSVCIVHV